MHSHNSFCLPICDVCFSYHIYIRTFDDSKRTISVWVGKILNVVQHIGAIHPPCHSLWLPSTPLSIIHPPHHLPSMSPIHPPSMSPIYPPSLSSTHAVIHSHCHPLTLPSTHPEIHPRRHSPALLSCHSAMLPSMNTYIYPCCHLLIHPLPSTHSPSDSYPNII